MSYYCTALLHGQFTLWLTVETTYSYLYRVRGLLVPALGKTTRTQRVGESGDQRSRGVHFPGGE
jgi:hypothetical protein